MISIDLLVNNGRVHIGKRGETGREANIGLDKRKNFFLTSMKVYIVAIEEALSEKSCVPVRHNTPYPTKVILSGMVELCLFGRFKNKMAKIEGTAFRIQAIKVNV